MTPADLRTLRRDTDAQIKDLFDTIESLMGEVESLESERDAARDSRAEVMSAIREAAADPVNDVATANRILDAAEEV